MDKEYWFSKKQKQFLKGIDTFYYSVKLSNDFRQDTSDPYVLQFRKVADEFRSGKDGIGFFNTDFPFHDKVDHSFNAVYRMFTFSRFYNFCLEKVDDFDMFVSNYIPSYDVEDPEKNKTPEIIVQIRSCALWEKGVYKAFSDSLEFVKQFCAGFGFDIVDIHENRCDYACHTNYITSPEKFFSESNFFNMQVSSFRGDTRHNTWYKNRYESDYIALGRRGDKCFVRIYLKTKEVVEQGYKGYFLKMWHLSGMISNYDFYCLEEAYKMKSWIYLDVARLKWALHNDDTLDEKAVKVINDHLSASAPDYDMIHRLADRYTPMITKILNIEFQVMYKMSRSFEIIHLKDNEGITRRIYDYLDNYCLIYEYLTRKTLRLVRTDQKDTNKSRRDNIEFWNRLRSAKSVDMKKRPDIKLLRQYSTKLDIEVRKKRAVHSLSNFAYLVNHNSETDIACDASDLLSLLNDNDIKHIKEYKEKICKTQNKDLPLIIQRCRNVMFYDLDRDLYFCEGDVYED